MLFTHISGIWTLAWLCCLFMLHQLLLRGAWCRLGFDYFAVVVIVVNLHHYLCITYVHQTRVSIKIMKMAVK